MSFEDTLQKGASIASSGSSILGGVGSAVGLVTSLFGKSAEQQAKEQAKLQYEYWLKQQEVNDQYATKWYNKERSDQIEDMGLAYSRTTESMRNAGINPALALSNGALSSPSVSGNMQQAAGIDVPMSYSGTDDTTNSLQNMRTLGQYYANDIQKSDAHIKANEAENSDIDAMFKLQQKGYELTALKNAGKISEEEWQQRKVENDYLRQTLSDRIIQQQQQRQMNSLQMEGMDLENRHKQLLNNGQQIANRLTSKQIDMLDKQLDTFDERFNKEMDLYSAQIFQAYKSGQLSAAQAQAAYQTAAYMAAQTTYVGAQEEWQRWQTSKDKDTYTPETLGYVRQNIEYMSKKAANDVNVSKFQADYLRFTGQEAQKRLQYFDKDKEYEYRRINSDIRLNTARTVHEYSGAAKDAMETVKTAKDTFMPW